MSFAAVRPTLIGLHRWIGLVLAPLFLLILLSGAVLSFRPILAAAPPSAVSAAIDAPALTALIGRLEAGGQITSITLSADGRTVDVASPAAPIAGRWAIASATRIAPASGGIDVFRTAESLHKSLLLGLGLVVEVASFAMLAIMLAGPFLAWLRFRNSLIGWHMIVGWCLLPFTLVAPVTAAMMILGLGEGARAPLPRATQPLSISQALTVAARELDTRHLATARGFRGGTVMLRMAGTSGGTFVVTDQSVTALTGGPSLVKQIHEGTWAGAWSGSLNLAIALALLGLTGTGCASWLARWRRDHARADATSADILVAHASQTGTATRLATATCDSLTKAGERAIAAPLGALTPARIRSFRLILLIAATTGEGEVPDGAKSFVRTAKAGELQGVRFAVLALGDSRYTHFCRGAETLEATLLAAGATEAMPMTRADGEPTAAWRAWLARLGPGLGLACAAPADAAGAAPLEPLVVAARRRLDDPSQGETQETWSVILESLRDLSFRPGDLLRLAPADGGPPRSYSIGSSSLVDPRRLALTVRLHRLTSGNEQDRLAPENLEQESPEQENPGQERFGKVSGLLIRKATLGARLEGRIDAHSLFHPPADPRTPVLMIAAGSGIAPFPGFLAERKAMGRAGAAPGPAWLIFGNRHREGDFLWRELWEASLADGSLARLDTAFSRDHPGTPVQGVHPQAGYVQEALRAEGQEALRWIEQLGAVIYVCGSRKMAQAVLQALVTILSEHGGRRAGEAEAEVTGWLADGRLRIDAFD